MNKHVKKRTLIALKICITLCFLSFLIKNVDSKSLFTTLKSTPTWTIIVVSTMWGLAYLLLTLRLQKVLHSLECKIGLFTLFRIFLWGNAFNTALPGSAGGDLVMIFELQKDNKVTPWKAPYGIIVNRLLALVAMALISATLWIAIDQNLSLSVIALTLSTIFIITLILPILLIHRLKLHTRIPKFIKWPRLRTITQTIIEWGHSLTAPRTFTIIWSLTWLNQAVFFTSSTILLKTIGIPLDTLETNAAIGIMTLASCLPISLGGHGVRETSLAASISYLAPNSEFSQIVEQTLSYSIIAFGISLGWAAIGILIHYGCKRPMQSDKDLTIKLNSSSENSSQSGKTIP